MMEGFFEPLPATFFFAPLELRYYTLLVVDPPWNFNLYSEEGAGKSASRHYNCMSNEEIRRLPVADLADEHCLLYLWSTAPQLPLAIDCVGRWGFDYKSFMVWEKTYSSGKVRMGTGYRVRTTGELVVVAAKGKPRQAWTPRTIFRGVAREHSRKPEEFYAICERLMPGARRADVFSRTPRRGWDVWGDEADKFEEGA